MNQYQPRNRRPETLPILEIQVEHAAGIATTDPTGACASAVFNATGEDLNERSGITLKMDIVDLHKLEPLQGRSSILSPDPAFLYRSDDLEIPLSREELHRLMDQSLKPKEYFKLREIYGIFHEIHDDFYDYETGTALQPVTGCGLGPAIMIIVPPGA